MLNGFTAGLLLIALSELGDKSFFISIILATRHPRRWIFIGVLVALSLMTVLSVLLGQVATLFPQHYVRWLAIALFLGFGFKMLYDAAKMARSASWLAEQKEAAEAVQSHHKTATSFSTVSVLLEAFLLTFFAEWGDRTQIATITLAAANHPLGVALGATLGHGMATAIAVISGNFISGRISERWLTVAGGCLFLIFGAVTAWKTP